MLQAGYHLVRYSDDFIILCATRLQAEEALRSAERLLREIELKLKPEKTRIVHLEEGFTFLGYAFTTAGKHPSDQAVSSLRKRLSEVSCETTRRQILAGWQGYFKESVEKNPVLDTVIKGKGKNFADELPDQPGEKDFLSEADFLGEYEEDKRWWEEPVSAPDWEEYQRRFIGRSEIFGRFWQREDGRQGYIPVRRVLTTDDLESHLRGETVLATYLLHPDGTTQALVLDIDGPEATVAGEEKAFALAIRLVSTLAKQSLEPLWFSSGGKGCHLWFCFQESVPAKAARQWIQSWLEEFRPFPGDVLVEIFPKQDYLHSGALGSLIRLPLGRHPKTGQWSKMLNLQGQQVVDPWIHLKLVPLIDFSLLISKDKKGFSLKTKEVLPPSAELALMVEGCSLVQALVKKAAKTHHLRHTERLALLYVLGGYGETGQVYLHQVVGCCSNYSPRLTERWIRRLEEGHKPIRCVTLREWLKDYLPDVACNCQFKEQILSPLEFQVKEKEKGKGKKRKVQVVPKVLAEEEWEKIAQDLFPGEPGEHADLKEGGEPD